MSDWKEYRVDEAADLLKLFAGFTENYALVFRGQASSLWPLNPSIQRHFEPAEDRTTIAMWEGALIQNFRRHSRCHLPPAQMVYLDTVLGTLTLMQHYSAPTRLLDWTFSIWVAAYFACATHENDDGVIWGFNRDRLSRDAELINAPQEFVDGFTQNFVDLTDASTVMQWSEKSHLEIPAFSSYIYEFADQRVSAQQSLFTFSGTLGTSHADELSKRLEPNDLFRVVIPASIKPSLLQFLWRMNIGAISLFPGMDGVGRFVNDAIRCHLPLDHAAPAWILHNTNDGKDFGLT